MRHSQLSQNASRTHILLTELYRTKMLSRSITWKVAGDGLDKTTINIGIVGDVGYNAISAWKALSCVLVAQGEVPAWVHM